MTILTVAEKHLGHPWSAVASGLIKTWADDITTKANAIVAGSAGFLTADAAGRAVFADSFWTEAAVTSKFVAASITTAILKAGIFSSDVTGRALMATGYFTEAKATDAFAAGAVDGATLLKANSVTGAKLAAILFGTASTRSGAGAVPITSPTCLFTSTGGAQALTIADGATGQRLRVVHTVDGGSGVVTQTTGAKLSAGITTITLTNRFDWFELEWTGTLWEVIGYTGATIA